MSKLADPVDLLAHVSRVKHANDLLYNRLKLLVQLRTKPRLVFVVFAYKNVKRGAGGGLRLPGYEGG